MTRGVQIPMEEGGRFGRLTVLHPYGSKALVLCDCGSARVVTRANLANGNTKSCGCWRIDNSRAKAQRDGSAQTKRGWQEGWYDREKSRAQAKAMTDRNCGTPSTGGNAKGPSHHTAKWYAVRSPAGVILKGLNLSHLVRENAHLFAREDVAIRRNKWGTEIDCKAMRGLRMMFTPKARAKDQAWKGWTAVERRDAP